MFQRLALAAFLIWALTFCTLAAVSAFWPQREAMPMSADAIVCLGGGMSRTGWERPDPASTRRARTCADLYHAGVAPVIVFTGYGHEVMSAAEAMANLAEANGVPPAAVILEPQARSTIQNAAFSLALLQGRSNRILVVSDAFHLPRAWLIFRSFGVQDVALFAANTDYTTQDRSDTRNLFEWILRESFAVWVNLGRLFVYLVGGMAGIDHDTRIAWFD